MKSAEIANRLSQHPQGITVNVGDQLIEIHQGDRIDHRFIRTQSGHRIDLADIKSYSPLAPVSHSDSVDDAMQYDKLSRQFVSATALAVESEVKHDSTSSVKAWVARRDAVQKIAKLDLPDEEVDLSKLTAQERMVLRLQQGRK